MSASFKISLFLFLFTCVISAQEQKAAPGFWDRQEKGANVFNKAISSDVYEAAAKAGIRFVRLAPDKWKGQGRDFLIGNADNYTSIPDDDFKKLKTELDNFDKHGVKVVITMLSLPGCRWKQNNGDENDFRLWSDKSFQEQTIKFWKDLASKLKGNKAIVAYNILNEPRQEFMKKYYNWESFNELQYVRDTRNTTADLNLFYEKVVKAIRKVDPETPIILDAGMNADPRAFRYFKPVFEKNILYAFHMYEPYYYTNRKENDGKYSYPGKIVIGDQGQTLLINKAFLKNCYFREVISWQNKYKIPSDRIIAEEFGCSRFSKGADKYLKDLIKLFNEQGWHWAFYSFREDEWDGMDYELGTKPLGVKYWQDAEAGKNPTKPRQPNELWNVVLEELNNDKATK